MQAIRTFGLFASVIAASWTATATQQGGSTQEVVVDVVVLDQGGQPVVGLRPEDFRVREDGRDVKVSSFQAITPAEDASRGRGRSAVIALDDVGVPIPGLAYTTAVENAPRVKNVADRLLSLATPTDTVGVIRFSQTRDEIAGPRNVMAMRVAEFVGGARPFRDPDTIYESMRLVASVSSDLVRQGGEPRRHAIIWIGEPALIDIREPPEGQYAQIWPRWREAVMAASRAHASVYAIHPQRGARFDPDGIPAQTGGTVNEVRDVMAGAERIWNEIGYYYLLTYTPPRQGREVYEIDVRVSRPNVTVRERRIRG